MGRGREVPVSFDSVRDKNVMQLTKLNLSIFPVNYDARYYADALASDFSKLGNARNVTNVVSVCKYAYVLSKVYVCVCKSIPMCLCISGGCY